MRFSFLSFFHHRNNIYLDLQQITSFWLLSRVLRPSNFVVLCREKNFDLDISCLFVWNYYKKYHPTKSNEKITVVLSSKLFETNYTQYHFQSYQGSELQEWFRHHIRVERRSDKINDFQFCACDDSLFKNNKFNLFKRRKCWQKQIPTG